MTTIYDQDIKFHIGFGKHFVLFTTHAPDVEIGQTMMTIDIHEKGCVLSTTLAGNVNPKGVALAQTYCEVIRKEMNDVLSLTDEQYERWNDLAAEYKESGVSHPLSRAYDEVKSMMFKQDDSDKDKDVC